MIDTRHNWTAYGAKFSSGYDKDCPIMELMTILDTPSDAYVTLHPEMLSSLHRVSDIILDETDAWVGCYSVASGAVTDSIVFPLLAIPEQRTTLCQLCRLSYYP